MEKIIITGHLGQNATTRMAGSDEVANFSVGVSQRFKKDGQTQEKTTWYNCTLWRPSKVLDYLKKGQPVLVEGRPAARTYQTRDGQTAVSMDITVSHVELLGKNPNAAAADASNTEAENTEADPFANAIPQGGDGLPY